MTRMPATPDRWSWYHGWNIVAIAVLAQIAANGMALNSMSLFLSDWARDLHCPISQILLAMAPMGIVAGLISPIVGSLVDRYPARWLFGVGLAGIAAFDLAMSMVVATWQLWALYGVIFPVAMCLCTTATANAVVSRWFVRRIGLALGITAFGVGASGVLLPPIIAHVMPIIGWRSIWRIASLLVGLVVLPLVVWKVRDRPEERDGVDYLTGGAQVTHAHHGRARSGGDLRWVNILARGNFWLLVACFLPILALSGALQMNLAPIAASRGFDSTTAGFLIAAFSLSSVASALLMGFLSDRFGNRLPLAGLALLLAAGGALIGYGHGLPALMAGVLISGFAGGIWTLLPATVAVEFGADGVGRALGALGPFILLTSVVGPLVAKAEESTGVYGPALLGLAALCLVGGGLVLLMREKRRGCATPLERRTGLEDAINPLA